MSEPASFSEPRSFSEAKVELDKVLAEIEDDRVDIDRLAVLVTRARELVEWCRRRIEAARIEVTEVTDG